MSQKYFTTLTNIGAALHANAQLQQTTVPWTHLVLGDGNGVEPVPSPSQTGVIREVDRLAISSIEPDPENPSWIVVEAVIPSDRGGYVVRETALMGGAGGNQCIAVGNYPSATKPLLSEGAGSELVIRVVVEIAHTATVTLKIDPAVVIASRDWVEKLHATESKRGIVQLATKEEAEAGDSDVKLPTVLRVMQLLRSVAAKATSSLRGTVMLATNVDGIEGINTEKAVTSATVLAALRIHKGVAVFTSNGSWTVPKGVSQIWVSACAGGGGGGAGAGYVPGRLLPGGGGGAGQSVIRVPYNVAPGQLIGITVGARGNGGLGQAAGSAGGNGGAGGTTVVGALLTLAGGSGGEGGNVGGVATGGAGWPRGSAGASATTMDVLITSGAGASSPFGSGGGGAPSASWQYVGIDATGFGSGGSGGGGLTQNNSGPNGGFGSPGFVQIEW